MSEIPSPVMEYRPAHQHSHSTSTSETISVSQTSQANLEDGAARKSFQSVDIREVPGSGTASRTASSRWSKQSAVTLSEKTRVLSKTGSWTFEVFSLLVAVASVASIIGVLAHFDGRALPSWPYDITLNALIALLATIANASMAVPLSSGLSQLKWIRFKTSRAPLTDMEVFDEASRGTWGALKMLFKLRGGFTGSFGALVAIVALTLGPFSQQIATYRVRNASSDAGATNYRALNYTAALPGNNGLEGFVPILPMKAAVYNGLFAENGKPWLSLPVVCQTGNCTWQPFESLGVCHECVDMSQYMTRYCADGVPADGNVTDCGWSVPAGAVLNSSADVFSMTSLFPSTIADMSYSTIMKLIFMGTESQDGLAGDLKPWARQCTLSACVQTIQSSITNGELAETITSSVTNASVPRSSPTTTSSDSLPPILITGNAADNNGTEATYTLSAEAMLAMRSWFGALFTNGSASRNADFINNTFSTSPSNGNNNNVLVNLTVGISSGATFFDTDIVQAFYWNYYEYPGGVDLLVRDLATSVSVSFRSFAGAVAVAGVALRLESFVHVRWGFVAAPVLAVVLAAVFLGAAVWRTGRVGAGVWKGSALAMLVHGVDEEVRERVGGGKEGEHGGLGQVKREARDVRVRLDEVGGRWALRM